MYCLLEWEFHVYQMAFIQNIFENSTMLVIDVKYYANTMHTSGRAMT